MEQFSKYVGLDVHKDTIVVSIADTGRTKARHYGTIKHTAAAVSALLKKINPDGEVLELCYEAGPCGYGLYHQLTASGHQCQVVAPTLIPRRASDKVKTDRRDSLRLAELLRAGELTSVWVPDAEQEAIRDLVLFSEIFRPLFSPLIRQKKGTVSHVKSNVGLLWNNGLMRDVVNCTIGGNAVYTGFEFIAARWFDQTAGVNPHRVTEQLS